MTIVYQEVIHRIYLDFCVTVLCVTLPCKTSCAANTYQIHCLHKGVPKCNKIIKLILHVIFSRPPTPWNTMNKFQCSRTSNSA